MPGAGLQSNCRGLDAAWLLLWGVVSSIGIVLGGSRLSATFDEPLYLQLGLTHWRTGSTHGLMRVGTMPLPVDVATLPVFTWEKIRGYPVDPTHEIDRALFIARLGSLVFWWLLLIVGWKLATEIGGPWSGRLVVAVLACEPNLLAHAGLATTDLALTACTLLFCWSFRRGRTGGWWMRVGWPAATYGLAMLAKASALAFVPLCAIAIEADRLWSAAAPQPWVARSGFVVRGVVSRRSLCDAIQVFWLGTALVYIYCGSDWQREPSFVAWAASLPDNVFGGTMRWLAEHLRIFNNAGVAFARQFKHNIQGHGAYLLGESTRRSFWFYFPVALSMKSAEPMLLAPIVLALLRIKSLRNAACMAAMALALFSIQCRVQIGIRLVLPILALAAIGLSCSWIETIQSTRSRLRRGLITLCVAASVGWMALANVRCWPAGLTYINEFWGGRRYAHLLLSDSNCDWGQGLLELAEWQGTQGGEICVWYFGTDPRIHKPPFVPISLHREKVYGVDELSQRLAGRRFAVGKTLLYGAYPYDPLQAELVDWLRRQAPIAETSTFLIFKQQDGSSESGKPSQARSASVAESATSKNTPMRRNF